MPETEIDDSQESENIKTGDESNLNSGIFLFLTSNHELDYRKRGRHIYEKRNYKKRKRSN